MITDQDIDKLKGVFLTKQEAKGLLTKEDAKAFASKEALDSLTITVNGLHEQVGALTVRHDKMDAKLDTILTSMDFLTGAYRDSLDEHAAGAQIMMRHDRQIAALSTGTGVPLPD